MNFNRNNGELDRFQPSRNKSGKNPKPVGPFKKFGKNSVHPQQSLSFTRKDAMRIATIRVSLAGHMPHEMRNDEEESDNISSSSVDESDNNQTISIAKQIKPRRNRRVSNKMRLLKHIMIFVFRLTKRLEHRKLYGVPKFTLNPHFKPLELIRRNINYNSYGYGSGLRNLQSTLNLVSERKTTRWLFFPNQSGIVIWNIISIGIITFLLVYVPSSVAFDFNSAVMDIFDYFIDVFFLVDLLINFNLAQQLPDGTYEISRVRIAKNYLKGYFSIDFITSFPFGWVLNSDTQFSVQYNKALRVLKLPKMISTLKLARQFNISTLFAILKLGDMWRYRIKSKEGFFKILLMVLLVFLAIHIGSCIWIIIGSIESFDSNTWIVQQHFTEISDSELYITAFYYCLVVFTTVGYGDVRSFNSLERCFSILWMMFGIAFYSFTISFITEHFTNIETPKSLLNKKLKQLKTFAASKMMPSNLVHLVQKNLEHASAVISYRWVEGHRNLLIDLPLELKYYFYRDLHREVLRSPFFDSNNDAFAVRILERLKPVRLKRNQFFWGKNDIPSNLVFIVEGKMFYLVDNVYYRGADKLKKDNMDSADENGPAFRGRKPYKSSSRESNSRFGKIIAKKMSKLRSIFGLKDVKRTFGSEDGRSSEFKNHAQIKRHLMTDPTQTQDIRNLPLVAFRIFGPGSYLGEEEIIWPSPRKYYLKAATDVQLMILPRADFETIVKEEFPEIYKKLVDYGEARRGFFAEIKKQVLKEISLFFRNFNAVQFQNDTRTIIEKSFYLIRKGRERYGLPNLDSIIKKTSEENSFIDLLAPKFQEQRDEDENSLDKMYARDRAKSPGLMKMYTNWRSTLIRASKRPAG